MARHRYVVVAWYVVQVSPTHLGARHIVNIRVVVAATGCQKH